MKDINFFEPYIEKKSLKLDKGLIFAVGLGLLLLLFTGTITYKGILITREKKAIRVLEETSKDPARLKKLEEVQELREEIENYREEISGLLLLDQRVVSKDKIDHELLKNITRAMPEDVFLNSFAIYPEAISLSGSSKDKWSVAEFARGLDILSEEIFISNITLQGDYYDFSIDIDLNSTEEDIDLGGEEIEPEEDGPDQSETNG